MNKKFLHIAVGNTFHQIQCVNHLTSTELLSAINEVGCSASVENIVIKSPFISKVDNTISIAREQNVTHIIISNDIDWYFYIPHHTKWEVNEIDEFNNWLSSVGIIKHES